MCRSDVVYLLISSRTKSLGRGKQNLENVCWLKDQKSTNWCIGCYLVPWEKTWESKEALLRRKTNWCIGCYLVPWEKTWESKEALLRRKTSRAKIRKKSEKEDFPFWLVCTKATVPVYQRQMEEVVARFFALFRRMKIVHPNSRSHLLVIQRTGIIPGNMLQEQKI
ncbi:hypothetical protein QE152_g25983 [Popillia japonica]|uniref:Uncharacterized protein n=1 Tax=Popillia japonica TaxID=7064 RepID=A0AAW1K074_POPJA